MKKTGVTSGAVCAAAILVSVAGLGAQGRRTRPAVPPVPSLLLQGPGASIGVAVSDRPADTQGVAVVDVRKGSPADTAGVREGDVVVEFDGERARSARQLSRLVQETAPGRTVEMRVLRDGKRLTLKVSPEMARADTLPGLADELRRGLETLPRDLGRSFEGVRQGARLGLSVTPLTDQLAAHFGVEHGVLVTEVVAESPAAAAGIAAGDVITGIGDREVVRVSDVTMAVREARPGATLSLRIMRDHREVMVEATLPARPQQTTDAGRPV